MTESFMKVYEKCITAAIPSKEVKLHNRRNKPHWWNGEMKEAKHKWNMAKKSFKRRQTPINLKVLKEMETEFIDKQARAKEEWTQNICKKIATASTPQEMWDSFKYLTTYEDRSSNEVLPLINSHKEPIFSSEEKSKLLQETFFSGKHLNSDKFDESFKERITNEISNILVNSQNDDIDQETEDTLNYEISKAEIEAVFQSLANRKTPGPDKIFTEVGPDKIFTEVLKHAGSEMIEAIYKLFNKSWETSEVPKQWKEADVKFLRKPGKASYHEASSYRPISLTSYLCKSLEKILFYRLYGFVEHNNLLDQEQEGFRKYRSTTQALLRLTQEIINGLNDKQHTLAIFIDLEKAYDSVWRDGLMYKMYQMGIRGKMWSWLHSFLSNRGVSIKLNEKTSPSFQSEIGLPQGSVISSILFNIFIKDIYSNVKNEKVKFADDGTIWKTGNHIHEMAESIKQDLITVMQWATKWRMNVNLEKTEICAFSRSDNVIQEARQIEMKINDTNIQYNTTPKILGVTLDEKLKFNKHIENIEQKSQRAIDALRKVKECESISTKCLLQLYKALVLPQIEYAAAVWQTANCDSLGKIQRKGLGICIGAPSTAGVEALEVETGVLPLAMRREELAIREGTRIIMKNDSCPIKQTWNSWKDNQTAESKISPFKQIAIQLVDMTSNTGVETSNIEAEPNYLETLIPTRTKPEYWTGLGSSNNRSTKQTEASRNLINGMIAECNVDSTIIFTDGSCLGNPGPCGAGACIYPPNQPNFIELKKAVSKHGSILLGELVAILIALEFCENKLIRNSPTGPIHIFSDSQTAIGILNLGWESNSHISTVSVIKHMIKRIHNRGGIVNMSWTPGHAGIRGNDIADTLAKAAATEAQQIEEEEEITSYKDIKTAAKVSCTTKWQRQWDATERGRRLHTFRPSVNYKFDHIFKSRESEKAISQLRTGYSVLNSYQHKCGLAESKECLCGEEETESHYLIHCPLYEDQREKLRHNLFYNSGISQLDENILLAASESDDISKNTIGNLLTELELFILESGRFKPHINV